MIELSTAPAAAASSSPGTHKILAIDDSQTLRQFIARCLTRVAGGTEILLAKDGAEGVEIAQREKPDLILLDYVLPDFNGGEVCRKLLAENGTAEIPVVLMSSSAVEMQATEAACENVVKSIAKPFSPELLNATVNYVIRHVIRAPSPAAPVVEVKTEPVAAPSTAPDSASAIFFRSKSRDISILAGLLAIEAARSTGVLRVHADGIVIESFMSDGHCCLVSTRDTDAYLASQPWTGTPPESAVLDDAAQVQRQTARPIFFTLAERGALTMPEAVKRCRQQGLALFSRAWTAASEFEFETLAELPEFARRLPHFEGPMSEWAMESLRFVGDECQSSMAWGEPTGVPAYTRRGYERIQQIPLNDEEIAFAELISPTRSLGDIAASMKIGVETAQRILHRFLSVEILDYWPASLLRRA